MQRLPRTHKFRLAVRVPSFKLRDRRFRHHQAIPINAKIVVARDHSGKTIHQDSVTVLRRDVEHNPPPFSVPVTRPIVVCHHDLPVFCPASCSHESAAIPRAFQVWRVGRFLLLVQPRHVIIWQLLEPIEGHDVVHIQLRTGACPQPFDDPLQFLLILRINLRPQHFVRGFAEEFPVALRGMHHPRAHRREAIFDFRRQQVPVLISNGARITLQMHVNPASFFEPPRGFQSRIVRRRMLSGRRDRRHHSVVCRCGSLRSAPRPPQGRTSQDQQHNRCRPPYRIRAHLASLLSHAVSTRKNHTARPALIERESFHALLLVPFELNRAPRSISMASLYTPAPRLNRISCKLLCLPCSPPSPEPSARPSSIANFPSSTASPSIWPPPRSSTTRTSNCSAN